jgi:hypothetical protein
VIGAGGCTQREKGDSDHGSHNDRDQRHREAESRDQKAPGNEDEKTDPEIAPQHREVDPGEDPATFGYRLDPPLGDGGGELSRGLAHVAAPFAGINPIR